MEPIKNALSQAGNLVQQAAHSVAEAFRGGETEETTKDNTEETKGKKNDHDDDKKTTKDNTKQTKGKKNDSDDDEKTEKNIDSKQKKFDKEQDASLQHSEITSPPGGYHDQPPKNDAKVLQTSWPDLIGKTRHDAEEMIKAKGYLNIKVLKKGTSSTTEHDESRVILFVDDNDVVVEEPKVG